MRTYDSIANRELGNRLRLARENASLTQGEVASQVDIARTTLVAIEKGERKARYLELEALSNIYGVSLNQLLRRESIHIDLQPRFRKLDGTSSQSMQDAIQKLSTLTKAELEFEAILNISRTRNYLPERPILPGDVREQAEQDAAELRNRLGLGSGPIMDLFTLLEMELKIKTYTSPLDSKISGLFAFDDQVGPCIMVNSNHSYTRQVHTAAHEIGHYVSSRNEVDILTEQTENVSRTERYANAFGRAFLLPARGLKERFMEIVSESAKLTRRHIIILAQLFQVSHEALVRRLEDLQISKQGTWDWFNANGGITKEHVKQVLGDREKLVHPLSSSMRLNMLTVAVYSKELMSEGQLSDLLGIDRVSLRDILDDHESLEAFPVE